MYHSRLVPIMSIELVELDVESGAYEGRLNVPEEEQTDAGVVIVPGAGHGPFGNIFDVVSYELAGAGRYVFRVETWTNDEELGEKTLGALQTEVDAAVEQLRSRGCSDISVVAKSFGAGIALSHVPDEVDRLLLWAPAVRAGVDPSDATALDDRLGDADETLIGIADLDHVDVPVRILIGDEDRIPIEGDAADIPPSTCQSIADAVGGDVRVIPGENHSFNENRTAIVEESLDYLV